MKAGIIPTGFPYDNNFPNVEPTTLKRTCAQCHAHPSSNATRVKNRAKKKEKKTCKNKKKPRMKSHQMYHRYQEREEMLKRARKPREHQD